MNQSSSCHQIEFFWKVKLTIWRIIWLSKLTQSEAGAMGGVPCRFRPAALGYYRCQRLYSAFKESLEQYLSISI